MASVYAPGRNTTVYLLTKRGAFPTGLLYLVEDYLKKHKLNHTKSDKRVCPTAPDNGYRFNLPFEPYYEQLRASCVAVDDEARGIIVAPTGVGKSVICGLIVERLQMATLIVVPTLNLKRQLTDSLNEGFGLDTAGPLSLKGERMHLITVENIDALDTTKVLKGIACLIIDEFHHSAASTYQKLNKNSWKEIYYRFGLTATPFRSQSHERLALEAMLSKVIYTVEYKVAVAKGYIVPIEAYYIEVPTPKEVDFYKYAEAYKNLIVENDGRNEAIAGIVANLASSGESALCLVKQVEHGRRLQELVEQLGYPIPFVKGENDDNAEMLKTFNEGEVTAIGTHGCVGEGVDTKPCEWVVIATPMKSKNLFMQAVGRGFRRYPGKDSCKIILIKDSSHKFFKSAFKEQCRILLEEYGVIAVKI